MNLLSSAKTGASLMLMSDPVAVLFADLMLSIDRFRTATAWDGLISGLRNDVVAGATVIVTDGSDAFEATVIDIDPTGPRFCIHWNRPVSIPVGADTLSH